MAVCILGAATGGGAMTSPAQRRCRASGGCSPRRSISARAAARPTASDGIGADFWLYGLAAATSFVDDGLKLPARRMGRSPGDDAGGSSR